MTLTMYQSAVNHCVDRGMPEEQAKAVIQEVQAKMTTMKGRWKHDPREYPESFREDLTSDIDSAAVGWIDEHCPGVWYRRNFDRTVSSS